MRYEVIEILCDDSIEVLLITSSFDYANRYFRFMTYRYGDFRNFYIKDNFKGVNYENN